MIKRATTLSTTHSMDISSSNKTMMIPTDIVAVAAQLRAQLVAIEDDLTQTQCATTRLQHTKCELKEILRLFEIILTNEEAAAKELEDELEKAYKDGRIPLEDISFAVSSIRSTLSSSSVYDYEMLSTASADGDKENIPALQNHSNEGSHPLDMGPSGKRSFPRKVIPDFWKQTRNVPGREHDGTTTSSQDHENKYTMFPTVIGAGVRKRLSMKRMRQNDTKLKRAATTGSSASDWKTMPYKARKQLRVKVPFVPERLQRSLSLTSSRHNVESKENTPVKQDPMVQMTGRPWNQDSGCHLDVHVTQSESWFDTFQDFLSGNTSQRLEHNAHGLGDA